ncbi:hypothetical protein Tco_0477847 [Tanacetum coccineum]
MLVLTDAPFKGTLWPKVVHAVCWLRSGDLGLTVQNLFIENTERLFQVGSDRVMFKGISLEKGRTFWKNGGIVIDPKDERHIDDKSILLRTSGQFRCEIKEVRRSSLFPSSKFDGTPERSKEFTWGVRKYSSRKYPHLSTKTAPRRMLHLSLGNKASPNGGDRYISHFQIGIKSLVMSSASSAVTYTSVYTDSEPGRVFWGADEEVSDGGSPRVIIYGYDGLPMQPVDPPSPDYVPGPKHPPSPDYVPALSPGYVPDSDLEEDSEEHVDYPADGGDGDDEPSDDDSDDDTDDDEEPFEDEEDDEEEEEHPAPADSSAIPVVDLVPSTGDTEAFETDESVPTPRAPQIKIPFAQTRLRRAWKTVRPEPPMLASMEARIAKHAAVPAPPLPVASLPLPLPSPLTTSPTDTGAPLGYRAAGIRIRAAAASPPLSLPPTSPRTNAPEAKMSPWKRAYLTTPAPGYEIRESLAAGAVRQPGPTPAADTWDEIVEAMMEIALTTVEGVNQRVTELDTTIRQRTEEFEVRFKEAHDDRAYLNARVNLLYRDRPYHCHTALALDREAVYARVAWASSQERNAAIEAHVRTLEVHVATLIARTSSL